MIKKVLTIAGSDCSGGAGIQADIKTITVHGMYAMSVLTALTAQNTTGVYGVAETDPAFVARQIDCVFEDIRPDAVKIGMVANSDIIEAIAQRLLYYKAQNIVIDPVMVATSGGNLLVSDAVRALVARLLPLASVVTPNIPEAEVLCGFQIHTKADMEKAANALLPKTGGAVLIKGGHLPDTADDLLAAGGALLWFPGERVHTKNTHGTGCTLSSAIACNLAAGHTISQSVANAKTYVTGALKAGLNLGKGNGPLLHTYNIQASGSIS
jgi:hydroxymethylpyrimidine/phosphomethylpyrimidine kinase